MSVSAARERRSNAGNKMHAMVEETRAKLQSGEAVDSDEDADYDRGGGAGEMDDIIDSDFTETDSEVERAADDASKEIDALLAKADRKRKRKLAKKQRIVPRFAARQTTEKVNKRQTGASPPPSVDEDVAEQVGTNNNKKKKKADFAVRFSSRASAVRKAQETVARQQERDLMAAVKRTKRHGKHPAAGAAANSDDELTQEQLLEEAKLTETENLEKLSEFQQLEAEELRRQRMAGARKAPLLVRPVVHWKSSLEASTSNSTGAIDSAVAAAAAPRMHYSLEHLDRKHYPFNYWSKSLSIVPPKVCPITGQPARYFHPRAKVPYANMRAYHVLEEMMRGGHAYFYDIGVWSSTDIASGHEQ